MSIWTRKLNIKLNEEMLNMKEREFLTFEHSNIQT